MPSLFKEVAILYVADYGTCCVQKINTTGELLSTFGTRGSGNGQLYNPRGICLDNKGRVFVSECGNNRISVFKTDGTSLHHIIGNTTDCSNLNGPWGLAFDHCGNLHVADTNTSMIKVFTPEGQYLEQYSSGVNQPAGIAIDDEGNIFITDNGNNNSCYEINFGGLQTINLTDARGQFQVRTQQNQVCILNTKHNVIHSFGTNQNGAGITIDKDGFIYVCGFNNFQINKY